jgi:tetratricopeptide (TPR) repeat protein
MPCLTEERVVLLVNGQLAAPEQADVLRHVEECEGCRQLVAYVAQGSAIEDQQGPSSSPGALPAGSRIGRYLLLEPAGRGAMGVVYAAYDPDLNRKIAIKLLHAHHSGGNRVDELTGRLLREAQTMAQLSHPNVVAVHDVGTHGDQLFVAMDFVEGVSLRVWLSERPRPWREVLAVFLQAGRGLAAAHRAGIVHRDFKPDNVLIRAGDGRVCVTDFGLARTEGESAPAEAASRPDLPQGPFSPSLTTSGTVIGTPAYMSPEQLAGKVADPRADIFAFSVALYEALYRERPFEGQDIGDLTASIRSGTIRKPPPGSKVPAWLRRALLPGLQADPSARYASMESMLQALGRDPTRRLRRVALGVLLLGLLASVGVLSFREAERSAARCIGGEARIAESWNPDRQERIHAAFLRTGLGYAADAWARARFVLDAYARDWRRAYTTACEATHSRGEQSEGVLDLRMQCLERRRRSLSVLLDVFEHADAKAVERSLSAAHGLPDLEGCADVQRLSQLPMPANAAARTRVDALRAQLARGDALRAAGDLHEAGAAIDTAGAAAQTLLYKPIEAEASYLAGRVWQELGEGAKAESALHAAAVSADESRHDAVAARSKIQLVIAVGVILKRTNEALRWAEHARAAIARLGGDPVLEAELLLAKGAALSRADRWQEAVAAYEPALERFQKLGPGNPRVARVQREIGLAFTKGGRYTEALTWLQKSAAATREALGARHPRFAKVLVNVGIALRRLGRFAAARDVFLQALRIQEEILGPDALDVATTVVDIGLAEGDLGNDEKAIEAQRRALAIREKVFGSDHPQILPPLNNLAAYLVNAGRPVESLEVSARALRIQEKSPSPNLRFTLGARADAFLRLGRLDEALATSQRHLAVIEKALGPTHPDVAWSLDGLGRTRLLQGHPAEALAYHLRALSVREKALGTKHIFLSVTLVGIGRARLALGELAQARAAATRALALARGAPGASEETGEATFVLAQVQWALGHHGAARDLGRRAIAAFQKKAKPDRQRWSEINAWLASHR